MRKSLSRLMMGGLALLSLSSVGYAQTLNQDWKYTTDLPAALNARWGTGYQGKVYTNDKSVPQLIYWDKDGKHLVTDASGAALGMKGTGVTVDAAGNIIASDAFAGARASTAYKVLPAGGNALQDLTVTIPEGATAGRMDFIGRANGNVMSESGGAFYIATQNSANVSKIFVANGVQVAEKSKSFKGSVAGGSDGLCQPLDNNPESDNFIAKPNRTQKDFSYYENGEPVLYGNVGANSTAGGDVVVLNGVTYTIEPNQTNYCDGFQIVDRSKNEVVATHTEEFNEKAATSNQNALTVEKVDEYTANIYQYVPGQLVAKYTFSLPKPAPTLEVRNAYAYDIQVAKAEDKVTVSYRLNAPAESAKVQIFANGKLSKEFEGTVKASYTDDTKTAVDNLNSVEIPMTDIPKDALVSFKVSVVSATVDVATVAEKTYKFYHPQGVAIDNNPESPYFGRLYVTESMPSGANYHSGADGQGLYVFDQQLNPVKNAAGTYAFKGGQTFPSKFEDGAGKQSYDPRKVRISKDGRVFLSGQNDKGVALWEVNPADLNADFTQVIKGAVDAATYEMKTADGAFIAAPNVGMDVRGEGNNLKVLMLSSNKSGITPPYSSAGYRTDEYNLGTAKEWSQAPSNNVAALTGKYTVINTNTSVAYDNEGGIWYLNSRAEATDVEPALVHINAEGVEDYKEGTGYYARYGGGGIAFNKDFTRLAVACSDQTINIYTVTKGEDGAPVLTKEYGFATTIGRNCNDIAWDVADNLYIVGNSGEWLKSFSLPRASGEVVVAAASKYDMKISADEYPATLYVIGAMTNWNPAEGIQLEKNADGVYKGEITTTSVTDNMVFVSDLNSDWTVVNANRWGFAIDNSTAKINESNPIVKIADGGAITLGAVGTYKVTVDLKNLTVLFEGEAPKPVYPETLYVIGTIDPENPWDITDGSVQLVKDTDKAIYRAKEVVVYAAGEDEYGYISFTSQLGATSDDWTTVNPNRYGPKVQDTPLENEVSTEIVKNPESYKIKNGKYDIVINLEEGTIMVSEVSAGVESVESAVKVIAGRGVIRIEGEVQATSIYNINGQAVVAGSPEKEFNVSAGVYVVVTDGKTTKVLVK